MSWKDDCYARGGFATVFPNRDPYTGVEGEPACRLPDNSYVYMESLPERAERVIGETQDEIDIAMGNLVQFRDQVVSAVTPVLGSALKWGAVGLALFLALEAGLFRRRD